MRRDSSQDTQHDTLSRIVERIESQGDRTAVVHFSRDDSSSWSFGRLGREARRQAAALRAAGVGKGDRVAILAGPSRDWFAAALGAFHNGSILVPIDTQMPDDSLERIFEDSEPARVLTTKRLKRRIRKLDGGDKLDVALLGSPGEDEAGDVPAAEPEQTSDNDEAILFYTSGTSGPPKGVPLTHRNILFQIQSIEHAGLVNEKDRMLLPLPLHHVYPLVIGMLIPITLGITILLPHALTGEGITRALREGRGTIILGVPRLYEALFEGIRSKVQAGGRLATGMFDAALALSRLAQRVHLPVGRLLFLPIRRKMGPDVRMLASGGSPLDPRLAQNLEALGWPVAVGYGLTETSPLLTLKRPGEGSFATVGPPIEGVELKIDPEGLPESERKEQEAGKTRHKRGEVLARGPNVFGGYHKLSEKTDEAFSGDWFRTGDLGYIEDGCLHLGGRASSMIVLQGGENIDPEKLEAVYQEVDEVAEIGILEDDGKLAALVVPEPAALRDHSGDELASHIGKALKQRGSELASYQQLSNVEISRDALPKTNLGKIKRHVLEERYEQAQKGEKEEGRKTGPVNTDSLSSEDRALLEDKQAHQLWQFLAKRYKGRRLSPDSSLEFDLGIDSLEWVELSLSAQDEVGIQINERVIEEAETVRDLLELAADAEGEDGGETRRPIEEPDEVLDRRSQNLVAPRSAVRKAAALLVYGLLRTVISLRCRVEVRGLENLPEKEPFLLVPNHISFLDGPALALGLGYRRSEPLFWAGHGDVLFRNLLRRTFSRIAQIIPIDPKRGPISSLAVSALVIKRGHSLVWFPEGKVSEDGKLQDFQSGIGLIIDQHEPLVVPVFLSGTDKALPPRDARIPRSARIRITIGQAIRAGKLKQKAEEKDDDKGIHHRITSVLEDEVRRLGKAQKQD